MKEPEVKIGEVKIKKMLKRTTPGDMEMVVVTIKEAMSRMRWREVTAEGSSSLCIRDSVPVESNPVSF